MPLCYQVNLQTVPGGGEIYTRFFVETLAALGWETVLVVWRGTRFWTEMRLPARFLEVRNGNEIYGRLPREPTLVFTHNVLGLPVAARIAERHSLIGIVHMPFYGRAAGGLVKYTRLLAVSQHVRDSLVELGLSAVLDPEPLYAVADLRVRRKTADGAIAAGRLYEWDRRKFRDRALSVFERLVGPGAPVRHFVRRPGISIGIVSRLTPIKQFPLMFSLIVPALAREPGVNVEVFGSGGYASVRDLKRALAPLGERCRFWGDQPDVASVFAQIDYVLSGLPEKEALGLNLLEAQLAGTPVLAVNAPPFTETVLDGVTGHLFQDPRRDGGADFAALLARIVSGSASLDRSRAPEHLAKFSAAAFRARVARALEALPVSGAFCRAR